MVSAGGAPAGLLHYCGADTVSWHDFAQRIFHCASTLDDSFCMPQVQAIATVAYPSLAARPAYSALSCAGIRSEEHTSELQSLMRISYAVFCLKKKKKRMNTDTKTTT